MKKIILSLLFLSISFISLSQAHFQKGYIVKITGDTISGYLKHNTYNELSQAVEFRQPTATDVSNFFNTSDLKAFGFDKGDVFAAVEYTDASENNQRKKQFARIALEGYYSIYLLPRGLVYNYLLKSSDTAYVLYDDKIDAVERKMQLGNYRNMLAFLARDCDILYTELEKLPFLERQIVRIVYQINDCKQSNSKVYHPESKKSMHVVVHAGGFSLKEKWSQLSGGAELRLSNTIISRKLSFVTGFHYSKIKEFSYYPRNAAKYITEVYSVPAIIHYALLERVIQPYIYAGFAAAYKRTNFNRADAFDDGFQGNYGFSILGGIGVEIYPIPYLAIKADWRYELLLQHPTLGIAFRL